MLAKLAKNQQYMAFLLNGLTGLSKIFIFAKMSKLSKIQYPKKPSLASNTREFRGVGGTEDKLDFVSVCWWVVQNGHDFLDLEEPFEKSEELPGVSHTVFGI
jgi:hypothetical protein